MKGLGGKINGRNNRGKDMKVVFGSSGCKDALWGIQEFHIEDN